MQKLTLLALAGAIGTLARFGAVNAALRLFGLEFPWGTVVVNLLGCFLFGLVLTLSRERGIIGADSAQLILVGFMGAFTTFSSYVSDIVGLGSAGRLGPALFDVALQNAGGVACFLGGAALARLA
jgi:CrcB protein